MYRAEEIARPAPGSGEAGAKMTIFLDSDQAWADQDTLALLTYGAAFSVHTQLLQVDIIDNIISISRYICSGDGAPVRAHAGAGPHQPHHQRHGPLLHGLGKYILRGLKYF